jgi:hypothetical protein
MKERLEKSKSEQKEKTLSVPSAAPTEDSVQATKPTKAPRAKKTPVVQTTA